jgi:hypothetical protein
LAVLVVLAAVVAVAVRNQTHLEEAQLKVLVAVEQVTEIKAETA